MSDIESHDYSTEYQEQQSAKRSLLEIMRPKIWRDLTLPTPIIERLEKMAATDSIMNMLFYGKIGTGKTSAAHLFDWAAGRPARMKPNSDPLLWYWDGSDVENLTSVKKIRHCLETSCFVTMFTYTTCLLDRAHLINPTAQQVIPSMIEDLSDQCRFIVVVNELQQIIPEIRSRLMPVCFDIEPCGREEVQKRLIDRYERYLAENEIMCDRKRLIEIVAANLPDLRSIAKEIGFAFA
jgi:DNA polymerase III delta prime subunit